MFNNKGMTLIESLLAFEIFIGVLIVYLTLFTTILNQEKRVQNNLHAIIQKEEGLLYTESFSEIIEMVLH